MSPKQHVIHPLNIEGQSQKWKNYLQQKKIDNLKKNQLRLF